MLRSTGVVLVLISGSWIGWILSKAYLDRIKELQQLQLALNILNTEISYGQTLLPEAFVRTASAIKNPSADLFKAVADALKQNKGRVFSDIWLKQLEYYFQMYNLKQEDREILLNWGRQLGNSSLEEQLRLNKLTQKRLRQQEERAYETARKRVKLLRYSGVLLSILLIIIFY